MGDAHDANGLLARIAQLEQELAAARDEAQTTSWARRFHDDVLQHNRIGYFVIDRQGNHLAASESLGALLEFDGPLPPNVGPVFDALFPDEDTRQAAKMALFEDLTSDRPPRRLLPIRTTAGTEMWLTVRLSHLPDDQALITVQDVTHERGAQLALGDSERRLRTIFEAAQVGIAVIDGEGAFIDANPAFLAFVGRDLGQLRAQTMLELTHADDRPSCVTELSSLRDGSVAQVDVEKRFLHADGRTVWGHMAATWHASATGGESYIIAIVMDTTEHRRLEGELQMLDKLDSLGVLAGGIAHDFNNALTGVVGNVSLARMEARPASVLDQRLASAEAACARARELTAQLLTFSRGGAPVRRRVDLARLLHDTAPVGAAGSNVRCETDVAADLWPVDADETQIAQMIRNLVLNAVQAMPGGGTIRVEAHNADADVRLIVRDHGIGIPEAIADRVFEPFFTTREGGRGLGLSTAYSIAKRHGGSVDVLSTGPEGTAIRVVLPAADERVEARPEPTQPRPIEGARVLVMDDEPAVAEAATTILESRGCRVKVAAHGEAALDAYRASLDTEQPFDAVILDLTIPGGMGGKETIHRLREIDGGVRALVSSGYSNDPVMADHRAHGFAGVLPKPYSANELLETVASILAGG